MPTVVTLPALVALFCIDRDLHHLREGLKQAQRAEQLQEERIAQLRQSLEQQETDLRKLQAQMSQQELEMRSRQEHIEKMRASLNNTKTNKEYTAILVQISAEKAEVSKLETGVLEQMGQVEAAQKALGLLREQISAEDATLQVVRAESSSRVAQLQGQIRTLEARRSEAAAAIPPEPLRQYDRVRQKYPGDAMAQVEYDENDLDTISCGACYMGLRIDDMNMLRSRDEVRRCGSCGRILYMAEMLPHGLATSER